MRLCLRLLTFVVSLLWVTATVSASRIVYPTNTDTDFRNAYPNRAAPQLGECVGNCGADCGDEWNPGCGGRAQYWELQLLSEPQATGYRRAEYLCYGGTCYYYEYMRMQAMGRWTYHGYFAWGCFFHDVTCPEFFGIIGCGWFAGCGSGFDKDWSYEDVVFGWQPWYFWEIGPEA